MPVREARAAWQTRSEGSGKLLCNTPASFPFNHWTSVGRAAARASDKRS